MRIFPWDPDSLQTPGLEYIFLAIFVGAIAWTILANAIEHGDKNPILGWPGVILGAGGIVWAIWLFAMGIMA